MEHLAIMKKSWKLTEKILSGKKKIESRWYKSKYPPWDNIHPGEKIYFKNSGEEVVLKAEVERVLQFSNLTPKKVKEILHKYGNEIGIEIEEIPKFLEAFKSKNYCILIFIKNPQKIEPFKITKKGYGIMSAWITLENINKIISTSQL
ncbi:MAG TPA: ASCH domain-containing protein [Candidatus Paceibacterota bacterium]|nr:ASCH domain-containing protein [Candidatus Paceibacterota bacterium]